MNVTYMILTFYLFSYCKSLEIINPTSAITCGTTEDCNIYCNITEECGITHKTHTFYNKNIKFYCYGYRACQGMTIYAHDVQSIEFHFSGYFCGSYLDLYIDGTSSKASLFCKGDTASCRFGQWWFTAPNLDVDIHCQSSTACSLSSYSAIGINKFSLFCEMDGSCWNLAIYPPVKQFSTSTSNELFYLNIQETLTLTDSDVTIFSLDGMEYFKMNCTLMPCSNFVNGWILIYGSYMNNSCDLFNCVGYVDPINDNTNNINYVYADSVTYGTNIMLPTGGTGFDTVMAFIADNWMIFDIVCPSITNCIIVCIDAKWMGHANSCSNGVTINMTLADNGYVLINSRNMELHGPKKNFMLRAYDYNSWENNYYLTDTESITFDCSCHECTYCLMDSTIYSGTSLDVNLFCGENLLYSCRDLTLYSDLSPNLYLLQTLWNLNCDNCDNFPATLFFKNGVSCIYYHSLDTNCSNFPATSIPTRSPTQEPTKYPTKNPTKSPTSNPTKNPTESPTNAPTKSPTFHPTKQPTTFPTRYPTNYPTLNPTKVPTSDPSMNPSKFPTAIPTFNPTAIPTEITSMPTLDPSVAPTQSTNLQANDEFLGLDSGVQYFAVGCVALIVILAICAVTICYVAKQRKKERPNGRYPSTELYAGDLQNNTDDEDIILPPPPIPEVPQQTNHAETGVNTNDSIDSFSEDDDEMHHINQTQYI